MSSNPFFASTAFVAFRVNGKTKAAEVPGAARYLRKLSLPFSPEKPERWHVLSILRDGDAATLDIERFEVDGVWCESDQGRERRKVTVPLDKAKGIRLQTEIRAHEDRAEFHALPWDVQEATMREHGWSPEAGL